MQVILLESIDNLGEKDDIVTVKNGFGRNFLINQKKAIFASTSEKKRLSENLLQRVHKLEKIKIDAQKLADQLANVSSLQIEVKTSSTKTIFGSVTSTQIASKLEEKGFKIERKHIFIQDHIKEVGSYKARVRLHKDIIIEIPFEVVPK